MGRKKTFPMFQKMGHWRPRWRAASAWLGDEGGGKSTRSAGTPMKDCVMALPVGLSIFVPKARLCRSGKRLAGKHEPACCSCDGDGVGGDGEHCDDAVVVLRSDCAIVRMSRIEKLEKPAENL